jgi:hypothetical protein
MMRYSPSTGGFYDPAIHRDAIPSDAVAVTGSRYRALLRAQAGGREIAPGYTGRPCLKRCHRPSRAERDAAAIAAVKAEAARRIEAVAPLWRQTNALRSPLGSTDPLFARLDAIRAASDAIEQTIAQLTDDALAGFDPAASTLWPD